jgi:uncharacterized protein (TIGR00299 family) protein
MRAHGIIRYRLGSSKPVRLPASIVVGWIPPVELQCRRTITNIPGNPEHPSLPFFHAEKAMQIAYLDCFSGIAGDMCLGALIDAGADREQVEAGIASLNLNASFSVVSTQKRGFRGLAIRVLHPEQHAHRNLGDIYAILQNSSIDAAVQGLALRIFERLAKAEAKVHGTTLDRVTFHEVGAIDSIVDIVGTAIAWKSLKIDRAYASAVPTGCGWIDIAHGRVAIPAPATAELLRDVPIAPCSISKEMTTPTGAAILRELVCDFGPLPSMQVARIGYGAGMRDLEDRPNLLRILIGESVPRTSTRKKSSRTPNDASVVVLETNLDNVTGEQIGFAVERLWAAGALDVFLTPIQMKKNRPGTLLSVIAKPEDQHSMESIILQHTGTLGVRWRQQSRTILTRAAVDVDTPWGLVPGKVCQLPDGQVLFSPEYDACREIAAHEGLRLADVTEEVRACYDSLSEREVTSMPSEDSEQIDAPKLFDEQEPDHETEIRDEPNWYRWDSSPWNES